MNRDPRWLRCADAVYATVLRLYPRAFRERWNEPMRQAFRDRCREVARGERGRFALFAEVLPDLAFGAGRERIHAMEGMPVSKRNWMFVLLFAFVAMLAMHDRIGTVGLAAVDWWKQRDAALDEAALAAFYEDVGTDLERTAAGPREHALAALFLARSANPAAAREWQAAVDARDPLALWISAVDCPIVSCDRARAIAELARLEPDNAAIGQLELNLAVKAGDAAALRTALGRMAGAHRFDGHEVELVKGLLEAASRGDVSRRPFRRLGAGPQGRMAARTLAAAGIWMRVAQPAYGPFATLCREPVAEDIARDCIAAARILADGNTLIARSVGLKAWYRLAGSEAEREAIVHRLRGERWLMSNIGNAVDFDTAEGLVRWRDARLGTSSEIEAFRLLERRSGVLDFPPADFLPDTADLVGH